MSYNIKHSKFKNTGFLYEILIRQLSVDIINNKKKKASFNILKKYFFNLNKLLNKLLMLYNILSSNKQYDTLRGNQLLLYTIQMRNNLNELRLTKLKYFLINLIKNNFVVLQLFNTKVLNYKLLASIYKLFKISGTAKFNPQLLILNKFTILLHLNTAKTVQKRLVNKSILNFLKQDLLIRHIGYNLLILKFNLKFSKLLLSQKRLLKKYILGLGDIGVIKLFILSLKLIIRLTINSHTNALELSATKIKLQYIMLQVDKIGVGNTISENLILIFMKVYELILEMK